MTIPFLDRPYRPGVGLMLLNKNKDIFVAQRLDTKEDAWQMPQGGIDKGENAEQASFRELKEETGCPENQAKIIASYPDLLTYDLPLDLADKVWGGTFRGQSQKWFALKFLGEDKNINLESETPEFSRWRWASPAELTSLAVPFKKDLYERLLKELYPLAVKNFDLEK